MWRFFGKDSNKHFNYDIELEEYLLTESPFMALHKGKKKDNGDPVSIFIYDKKGCQTQYERAQAYIKRLKTLRHPCILTYIDAHETEDNLYLVTEYVKPLPEHLKELSNATSTEYLPFGIMQITKALEFLHTSAAFRHNNLFAKAIFVTMAGDWKLGEVGYITEYSLPNYPVKMSLGVMKYNPPESSSTIKYPWAVDSWGLGVLIWEVYNGPIDDVTSLKNTSKIPHKMIGTYYELVHADPSSRPKLKVVYDRGMNPGSFFDNGLVRAVTFLEEIQIREKTEKIEFFKTLTSLVGILPDFICMHKLLPLVVHAYDYGDAGVLALPTFLKLSSKMDEELFTKHVLPTILKMFASNDRATRCLLLENIHEYIDKIPAKIINDNIFPCVSNGFTDTHPKVRELTIKAALPLSSKLSQSNLDEGILMNLARLQVRDDQPSIRTNTTVCLGKIAEHLQPSTRKKVLVSGFTRALQDTFPPARNAGVLALYSLHQYFSLEDIARKILPALCPMCLDIDRSVRENTFKAIQCFLKKLEQISANPSLRNELDYEAVEPKVVAVPSWAGWASRAFNFYKAREESEERPEENQESETNSENNSSVSPEKDQNAQGVDDNNKVCLKPSECRPRSHLQKRLFNFEPDEIQGACLSGSFWDNFEPILDDNNDPKSDCDEDFVHIAPSTSTARKEERQRAMEARRKNKPGPMKLGTKIP